MVVILIAPVCNPSPFVMQRIKSFCSAAFLLLCLELPVSAQWMTQQIKLVPGFNAIYLEVTPPNPDCAVVFAQKLYDPDSNSLCMIGVSARRSRSARRRVPSPT